MKNSSAFAPTSSALPIDLSKALPATDEALTELATRAVLTGVYEANRDDIDAALDLVAC